MKVGGVQLEVTLAKQYLANVSQLVEIVVYALHRHHGLPPVVDGQCLVFKTLRGNLHLWQLPYLGEHRVVGGHGLSLDGGYLQLWVEGGEERCHQVVETVEHRECHYECHRGHGHTHHRYSADDIYYLCRLL